jgi:HAMP domain-containing protein
MASAAAPSSVLAAQARRLYCDQVSRSLSRTVRTVTDRLREQCTQVGPPDVMLKRRDLLVDLPRQAAGWQQSFAAHLAAVLAGHPAPAHGARPTATRAGELALVDDSTIDLEILVSRMALAMMDKASWEFSDLRYRMSALDRRDEMDPHDVLRPHALARAAVDSWRTAGLSVEHWRLIQTLLHEEFAALVHEAYHETNRWLIGQGVCPEVNLRQFIRRSRDAGPPPVPSTAGGGSGGHALAGIRSTPGGSGGGGGGGNAVPVVPRGERFPSPPSLQPRAGAGEGAGSAGYQGMTPENAHQYAPTAMVGLGRAGGAAGGADAGLTGRGDVQEETRMMTRSPGLLRSIEQAEAVLGRLNRLVSRQVPNFYSSTIAQPQPHLPASAGLRAAINEVQAAVQHRFDPSPDGHGNVPVLSQSAAVSTPGLLQELQARKAALKQAASTPVERATIEVVALMFQSLLTEERIPATVRVWFARLQMPVLRVAIAEPDFFATIDHPARKLIDRMGACVMGFEAGSAGVSEPMEREIKRVVQVVEAYPDTGRRVFQTVLTEFERFLEDYFKSAHLAASKGVSLAQQIEQRETLAIQYTIELRKMLNEVPVHDGVREFLFHVWADVLATTAVKAGQASEPTKAMRKAAADLIWLASAKVSREERSEAIRRLSPLLKKLREGMVSAGVPVPRQDEYIQSLNNALQAAFSARSATIPTERLNELMMQLETLEDMLPDVDHIEIDESMVRDLSGHETKDLEVVAEGGSMPTPAMVAWSHNLSVGSWFRLDYRDTIANVQLAWQGTRKQFSLFVSPQGRGILFQKHRLAAFLQAGLLVPVEEESLTVRATRDALAKLDADPGRLLH